MQVMIEDDVLLRAEQEVTIEGRAMLLPTAPARAADVVITSARIVPALSEKTPADKTPAPMTPPKSTPAKTAPAKSSTPRDPESTLQDEDGPVF